MDLVPSQPLQTVRIEGFAQGLNSHDWLRVKLGAALFIPISNLDFDPTKQVRGCRFKRHGAIFIVAKLPRKLLLPTFARRSM